MRKDFFISNMCKRDIVAAVLLVFFSLGAKVCALELDEKYPSYKYVLNEFDIDETYIFNKKFQDFAAKNEIFLRGFYKRSLQRGQRVLPTMQGMLMTKGVSDLFIYLSMVESGFVSHATSPKKAVGLWQFMPATAKQYNLEICHAYDERCDTSSATSAAIAHLNALYRKFGKWYLAAMAYNCGEGCLQKAIRRAGTDTLSVLLDDTAKYVPKETREYIQKILLVAMIGESSMISHSDGSHPNSTSIEVEVAAGSSLENIAKYLKMEYAALQKLNPKIKQAMLPKHGAKKTYTIRIPIEKVYSFYLQYELGTGTTHTRTHMISHYVQMGETLESIAKQYHTSVSEIQEVNDLQHSYLTLDQFLVIPVDRKVFENTLLGATK